MIWFAVSMLNTMTKARMILDGKLKFRSGKIIRATIPIVNMISSVVI